MNSFVRISRGEWSPSLPARVAGQDGGHADEYAGSAPNTWMVVEQGSSDNDVTLISRHATQGEAEAERDKRNEGSHEPHYSACIVLEPIAQRMGGRLAPTASKAWNWTSDPRK